jgi:hypothetical protein
MKHPVSLILFVLAVVAGGVVFSVAFKVSALEDQLTVLNKQITQDRDSVHVLRAEWSYLNQPERLDGLSQRYLELQPLKGSQISEIAALPLRPVPAATPDPALDVAPVQPATAKTEIASISPAIPKLKPAAPRRPSRHLRLASQPISPPAAGTAGADKAALDVALRAIFGNTASSAGGTLR